MKRKLILHGELAEKFGPEHTMSVASPAEAFKLMDVNFPEFRSYIVEKAEEGAVYACEVNGEPTGVEEVMLMGRPGDIVLTPLPAGASSGGGKILAALAIASVLFFAPVAGTAAFSFAGLNSVGLILAGVATNLALAGIQQLLAPDPSTDSDGPESYIFQGSEQNTIEGDPVPVLYGKLRVPGRPISIEIQNGDFNQ